jgi:4-carboxymuconolactone decarboxylase
MDLPKHYKNFFKNHPDIANIYEELGSAIHNAGPLDKKTRELIKLGISAGARHEGAVHSAARKALAAGASKEELRQTIFLSLTTIGFPSMMAALRWLEDIIGGEE